MTERSRVSVAHVKQDPPRNGLLEESACAPDVRKALKGPPRIAIVHDYLNQRGGAERVVASIHGLFPDAPIFTSILNRARLWPELAGAPIETSWMQHLPGIGRHFKKYFFLYPFVFDRLDLSPYDLVLSSSSTFAKGVRKRADALHVCYCHGPTRFLWDREHYLAGERVPGLLRTALRPAFHRLERWDKEAAKRPDWMIVNSRWTASRIAAIYAREAEVVHPPVSVERFRAGAPRLEYYLVVARLAGYKRVDLAVRACARLGRRLIVAGDGPARAALEALAMGHVEFIGNAPEDRLPALYEGARGLLVGALEDFGITMVEANAAGRPVIAYGRGGAAEILTEGVNGVLFDAQEVEAMEAAILRSETIAWDPGRIRVCAERFSTAAFERNYLAVVNSAIAQHASADS